MLPQRRCCTMPSQPQRGFTLIEFALVCLILGILSSIALPAYRDQVEKAQLAELPLRIDAMRVAMEAAYGEGNRSMFNFPIAPVGVYPDALANIPIRDSLQYPGLSMMLMPSAESFGQFNQGLRPYLVVAATDSDSVRTLRNLSDVLPDSLWAWWTPSTIMVVSLLDHTLAPATAPSRNTQPVSGQNAPGPNAIATAVPATDPVPPVGTPPTTDAVPATATDTPAAGTTPAAVATAAPAITQPALPRPPAVVIPANNGCVHPGNGHAYGRCSHNH